MEKGKLPGWKWADHQTNGEYSDVMMTATSDNASTRSCCRSGQGRLNAHVVADVCVSLGHRRRRLQGQNIVVVASVGAVCLLLLGLISCAGCKLLLLLLLPLLRRRICCCHRRLEQQLGN
jgi:hypothetical protein